MINKHIPANREAACRLLPDQSVVCNLVPENIENTPPDNSECHFPNQNDITTVLGHEHEMALLFIDVRDFTSYMESRSPYEVIYVIRKLFTWFDDTIRKLGGQVIETAGDSIYAVFGWNEPVRKAVQTALNASFSILDNLSIFNSTYAQPNFNITFQIGIGLHEGRVIIGQDYLQGDGHLTVMGLPVNIASRLQAQTRELNNNLIISEKAYSLLETPINTIPASVILKGISEPLKVRLAGSPYSPVVSVPEDSLLYYLSIAG